MNAGKSAILLQADHNYRERGMRTLLLTAQVDERDGVGTIASRIGIRADARIYGPEADLFELGARHAKHPAQEVYQELVPFFEAVSSPGFAAELEAMSGQFTSSSKGDFRRSYQQVMSAIDDIVASVELADSDRLRVANSLIEQALIEYRAGVIDGEISDLQEYQDARGFIEIAARFIAKIQNDPQRTALLANIQTAKKLWPDLDPKQTISGDESALVAVLAELQANAGAAP